MRYEVIKYCRPSCPAYRAKFIMSEKVLVSEDAEKVLETYFLYRDDNHSTVIRKEEN